MTSNVTLSIQYYCWIIIKKCGGGGGVGTKSWQTSKPAGQAAKKVELLIVDDIIYITGLQAW